MDPPTCGEPRPPDRKKNDDNRFLMITGLGFSRFVNDRLRSRNSTLGETVSVRGCGSGRDDDDDGEDERGRVIFEEEEDEEDSIFLVVVSTLDESDSSSIFSPPFTISSVCVGGESDSDWGGGADDVDEAETETGEIGGGGNDAYRTDSSTS